MPNEKLYPTCQLPRKNKTQTAKQSEFQALPLVFTLFD